MEQRTEIVFNRLFSGSFLNDNIGHEFVNMYKDDDGDNYVYIQPYGTYSSAHHNKVKYVLLTRSLEGRHALEVLGRAAISEDVYDPSLSESAQSDKQIPYKALKFGGATLEEIFRPNNAVDVQTVFISMRADSIMLPARKAYIAFGQNNADELSSVVSNDSEILTLLTTKQAKSSLKQYITSDMSEYSAVLHFAERDDLWTVPTQPIGTIEDVKQEEESFFDICGIADYELAFSNVLGHYMFKYPSLVPRFAKQVLGVEVGEFPVVERETDNIDLLLENKDELVVIENKITSKINGIKIRDNKLVATQLGKYYNKCIDRLKDESEARGYTVNKKIACFVLSPDYNQINLKDYDLPDFKCSEYYQTIFYSQVYQFLLDNPITDDPFFPELLKGISRHAQKYYNDLYADLKLKFVKRLNEIKSQPVRVSKDDVVVNVVPVSEKITSQLEDLKPAPVIKPAPAVTPVVSVSSEDVDSITLRSDMSVGDLVSLFRAKFGSSLRVYTGRERKDNSVSLSSLTSCNLNSSCPCYADMTVGDFHSAMWNTFGLKVKVYTLDEWVAVLDGLTLSQSGTIKKYAVRADMEAMLQGTTLNDKQVVNNNSAVIGDYFLQTEDDNSVIVASALTNAKAALRSAATLVGFQYNPQWTTRQFGSKFIAKFGNGSLALVENYVFSKEASGSIRAYSLCDDVAASLKLIAAQCGLAVASSWSDFQLADNIIKNNIN